MFFPPFLYSVERLMIWIYIIVGCIFLDSWAKEAHLYQYFSDHLISLKLKYFHQRQRWKLHNNANTNKNEWMRFPELKLLKLLQLQLQLKQDNSNYIPYRDSILAASLSIRADATHTIPRMSKANRKSITNVSKIRALMPWNEYIKNKKNTFEKMLKHTWNSLKYYHKDRTWGQSSNFFFLFFRHLNVKYQKY